MKPVNYFSLTLKIIIVSLFLNFSLIAQTTIIKGKLLDFTGNPSKYGLVGILEWNDQLLTIVDQSGKGFVKCDKNGNYSITIKEPGPHRLLFSIPGHNFLCVPVLNNKNKEFSIDVTLAPYKYKDNFDSVKVVGSFNNFNFDSPDKMIKQNNGTYVLEIKTDKNEVKYQLSGIIKLLENFFDRSVCAPGSSAYEPDSLGDYWSIMNVKDGKATIIFDPSKLLRSEKDYKVSFKGSSFDEKLFYGFNEFSKLIIDASQKIHEYMNTYKDRAGFQYDNSNYFNNLLNKVDTENDKQFKDYLKLIYIYSKAFNPKGYNLEKASAFFESLAPGNLVWELLPYTFYSCPPLVPQNKWNDIQDKFLKDSKSNTIKKLILSDKLMTAKNSGDEEEFRKVYTLIQNDYSNNKEIQDLLKKYTLESKIKPGLEVPDFEVTSIDNPNEKYSKTSMLGKIYMIDFWATWCGGCIMDMENIHQAYEKYKDKGFEIISLSSDESIEAVIKFRKAKWKMPWKNSFIGDQKWKKIWDAFEVHELPAPFLVSGDGKFLVIGNDLQGKNLEKTLSRYFK